MKWFSVKINSNIGLLISIHLLFNSITTIESLVLNKCEKESVVDLFNLRINKYSHLFDVDYIRRTTPDYENLNVFAKEVPGKGVGVFARRNIKAEKIVSYYKMKVLPPDYNSPFNGRYTFSLYYRNETVLKDFIGDIYEESLEEPIGGIPYIYIYI